MYVAVGELVSELGLISKSCMLCHKKAFRLKLYADHADVLYLVTGLGLEKSTLKPSTLAFK